MSQTNPREPSHPIHPLFLQRWSPRAFTGEPIPPAELQTLLEAARWAPSSYNTQPWRFVFAHRDTPAWAPLFESLTPFNQVWVSGASALVLLASRSVWLPPGKTDLQAAEYHTFDAGAAWASLAFQATLSGWQAHAMGGFDKAAVRERLAVPADFQVEAMIAIGKPGDKTLLPEAMQAREAPSPRRPLAELVAEGTFPFRD